MLVHKSLCLIIWHLDLFFIVSGSLISIMTVMFINTAISKFQEERLKRLKHRMKVYFDASKPDHQV